jgi:formate dehydrogenase subunit gamma
MGNAFMTRVSAKTLLRYLAIAALIAIGLVLVPMAASEGVQAQSSVRPPEGATTTVEPGSLRSNVAPDVLPRSDMWRAVREGVAGRVTIPDQNAATLVQSEGENFRAFRNGPLSVWGGWMMLAMVVVLAVFFALRGRIRVEDGFSGHTIERFNFLERFAHWLTAVSFIVLALTGLNVLYGRYVLLPVIGPSAFSAITIWGKYAHNYVGFAFMLGLVLIFVLWVRNNLPTMTDLKWLARGGGMFVKGSHPPAYKFNAGQKLLFWFVILAGLSVSISGICLIWPFEFHPFAPTFRALNVFGLGLPTELTALQETQLSLLWHAIVALVFITLVIAHIYIGTLGMEGAISAMTDGQVDENWAHQHHALWLEEVKEAEHQPPSGAAVPAE